MNSEFDVIIIGGGPGGLAAAIWCADLGLTAVILEKQPEFGGRLLWTFNKIVNYPGFEEISALDLRDRFLAQVRKTEVRLETGAEIEAVDLNARIVRLVGGRTFSSRAVIIATGVRRRKLGIPGEELFAGRGILTSGARDRRLVRGLHVVIAGGGDAALENALILSETAASVTVVHRRKEFTARQSFIESAASQANVTFRPGYEFAAVLGAGKVSAVEIRSVETGGLVRLAADCVLVRIGVEPSTELFSETLARDLSGYIETTNCTTNFGAVFAIGDVARPRSMTISTALGDAAIAAKAILRTTR